MRYEKAAIMFGQAFAERCILCNEKGVMPAPGGFQVKQLSDMPAAGTGETNLRARAYLCLLLPQKAPSGFQLREAALTNCMNTLVKPKRTPYTTLYFGG